MKERYETEQTNVWQTSWTFEWMLSGPFFCRRDKWVLEAVQLCSRYYSIRPPSLYCVERSHIWWPPPSPYNIWRIYVRWYILVPRNCVQVMFRDDLGIYIYICILSHLMSSSLILSYLILSSLSIHPFNYLSWMKPKETPKETRKKP